MKKNLKTIFVGIFTLLILGLTWTHHHKSNQPVMPVDDPEKMTSQLEDVKVTAFGVTGLPKWFLQAQTASRKNLLLETDVESPILTVFAKEGHTPLWQVKSQIGKILHGFHMHDVLGVDLSHRVHVTQFKGNNHSETNLETQFLHYDVVNAMIETQEPIQLKNVFGDIRGLGLRVDLKTDHFKILGAVKGNYEIPVH